MPFVPCPSCRRHVRGDEPTCPFCANALDGAHAARAVPAANRRMSRGALFAFAASMSVAGSVAACGGQTEPAASDAATVSDSGADDTGGNVAMYGAPADTGVSDDGGPVAAYGAPPDTGAADTNVSDDASSADSGSDDGGSEDDGGIIPAYGLPSSE